MRETLNSLIQWAREVGGWWWTAVVGVTLGGVALLGFVQQLHQYLLWVLVAALVIALAASFLAYHRERQKCVATPAARAEIPPPGGGVPHVAPVEYQVNALRQVIAKLAGTLTEFDYLSLDAVLKNHPRTGTDPLYEPLHASACEMGLARLAQLGDIEGSLWHWKIIRGSTLTGSREKA